MNKILLTLILVTLSSHVAAKDFKAGDNVNIKDNGWVCRSLEKAIASRVIEESVAEGGNRDIYQLNNGSCIAYSVRPLKIIKYDDYLIPGYPDKGKLFVSVKEPRSGETWHAFTGFLEKSH